MILDQLPALQVVAPLLAAPISFLVRNGRAAWFIALAVSWLTLGIAWLLLQRVLEAGTISYAFGGWAAPWGIEYRVEPVNGFLLLIIAGIGAVVSAFAARSIASEIDPDQQAQFYCTFLLCLAGMLGIVITGDAFNLFVFLEISSLSSYVLVSMGRSRRALTAAYQYLVMGTIGATFILIGVGFLYQMTGTLNMADLAARLPSLVHTRTVQVAFAFLTVGISLKLALFPLHLWLPNAYTYAPSAVTAFIAATSTKVAVYVLLRFLFTIFGPAYSFEILPVGEILLILAVIAVLTASTVAISQDNVKRMLAYSSLAQIGYMVMGVGLATPTGLTATVLHLFNHALMKGALFLALGCVFYRLGTVRLGEMKGLAKRMPWTMAAFVLGGMSLVGIPLTVGFVSKWYLILGAMESGWWPLAVVVIVGSLLSVVYVWRVVEVAYQSRGEHKLPDEVREAPLSLLLPTWVLTLANLYFGVDASFTVGVAQQAAQLLMAPM